MNAIYFPGKTAKPYTDAWLGVLLGEMQLFLLMFPYPDLAAALPQYGFIEPIFTLVADGLILLSFVYFLHSRKLNFNIRQHGWLLLVMCYFLVSSFWVDPYMEAEKIFYLSRTTFCIIQTLVIIQVFSERGNEAFLDALKRIAIVIGVLSFLFIIIFPEASNWVVKDPVRDESFFASPNNLGQFLAIAFIIINFYKTDRMHWMILIILNALLVFQAIRCNSMTSQVGVVICVVAYLYKPVLKPLYFLVMLLGIFIPVFTHQYLGNNANRKILGDRDLTFTGRSEVWDVLQNDLKTNHHEIFGFGAGGYWGNEPGKLQAIPISTIGKLDWARQGHNGYLDIRVMGGVVGLCIVVFFLFNYINFIYKKKQLPTVALFIPSIILFNNITESTLFRNKHFYFVIFMLFYWFIYQKKLGSSSNLATNNSDE